MLYGRILCLILFKRNTYLLVEAKLFDDSDIEKAMWFTTSIGLQIILLFTFRVGK